MCPKKMGLKKHSINVIIAISLLNNSFEILYIPTRHKKEKERFIKYKILQDTFLEKIEQKSIRDSTVKLQAKYVAMGHSPGKNHLYQKIKDNSLIGLYLIHNRKMYPKSHLIVLRRISSMQK